jgi:hypothetical protein
MSAALIAVQYEPKESTRELQESHPIHGLDPAAPITTKLLIEYDKEGTNLKEPH